MFTPHGPPSMESDAAYPYSGLIQHAYLTNKHTHFKKVRGWFTQKSNKKTEMYTNSYLIDFRLFTESKF